MTDTLWQQLQEFQIDAPGAALSFAKRLARENGWRQDYADRVIDEYRRFIYLVATSRQELTPSDQIDQAWHLHLTYTHSYWDALCENILGFALHHKPTRGGAAEQTRFIEQYNATLRLYEATFGDAPPADIWPEAQARFHAAEGFVRINRNERWLLPKPRIKPLSLFALIVPATLLAACTPELADRGFMFWVKVASGFVTLYYVIKLLIWLDDGRGGGGFGCGFGGCGGCSGCGGCGGCGS
jgi:hypothetical protein